jgi:hypothetical protein
MCWIKPQTISRYCPFIHMIRSKSYDLDPPREKSETTRLIFYGDDGFLKIMLYTKYSYLYSQIQ